MSTSQSTRHPGQSVSGISDVSQYSLLSIDTPKPKN